jgi:putative oxidoreductase
MAELKLLYDSEPRSRMADWAIRIGVAVFYVLVGADKFTSGGDTYWIKFFHDVGLGGWFRYFTGWVEIFGALLVLIPRTALIGLALLTATMAGAIVVLCLLGRPADGVFPGFFLIVLAIIAWTRWSSARQ